MKYLLNTLFLLVILSTTLQAQTVKHEIESKYVEVTGVAEMEIVPNEIYISITLQEEKEGMKRSVEEQEDILISKLKKLDVDVKNLKLSNVGSYTYWDKKNKESFKQKSFELKLTEAAKASEVMFSLNSLEIYRMFVARTAHSDIEAYRKQVKIDAVKAAKEKASYLLEAVDEGLGPVIFIVEQGNNYYGGYSNMAVSNVRSIQAEEYTPNPDVEFKPIILKYNILARFEIK